MKLFVNKSALRIFCYLLGICAGLPFLAVPILAVGGMDAFGAALVVNAAIFEPVHFVFGSSLIPVHEFGPTPGGAGVLVSLMFYLSIVYVVANLLSLVGKRVR
jgi:hypothetical protein